MRALLFLPARLGPLLLALAACGGSDGSGDSGGAGGGGGAGGSGGSGGAGGSGAPLTLASVSPASGASGVAVTLEGSGFTPGMQIFFGTTGASPVTLVSATTLETVAPAGPQAGAIDVTVRRDDGSTATLPGAFTYEAGDAPRVDWAILQFPGEHTGVAGSTVAVYGRVFEEGVTQGAGAGAGIEAELGVGAETADPASWTWSAAAFNVDADAEANDEYVGTLALPAEGTYRFTLRFRLMGGPWVYADRTGTDDGFAAGDTGLLTVTAAPVLEVDFCTLQYPAALSAAPGADAGPVFGRAYEAGVTDGGPSTGLQGEVGFGPAGSVADASWTWGAATFNVDVGNDDEWMGMLVAPVDEGTYAYAVRFRVTGSDRWLYCDLDGSTNGFDAAQAGALVVARTPPPAVDYAVLRPASAAIRVGDSATFEVELYEPGATEGAGAAAGVSVQLGLGPAGADPQTDPGLFSFVDATFARDADGQGVQANDVFSAAFTPAAAGSFAVVARVSLGDGPAIFVDTTSTTDGFDAAAAAVLEVTDAPAPGVDWCNLQYPTPTNGGSISVSAGQPTPAIYGRAYEPGVTDGSGAGVGLVSAVGAGPTGSDPTDPAAGWLWFEGSYNVDTTNDFGELANDEHQATLTLAAPGTYDYAFRFSLDGGASWVVCDGDGSGNGYASAQAGVLIVQ